MIGRHWWKEGMEMGSTYEPRPDGRGYTATQLAISLTRALSLLSQAGGSGQSNLSIRYRKDY